MMNSAILFHTNVTKLNHNEMETVSLYYNQG